MSLLTRLYDCKQGIIAIDGIDVKECKLRSLRSAIGVVQQEPTLFYGTIFDNVALGDPSVGLDRVEEACRAANAHEFITGLEKGYQTVVGIGGVQLSGGQKQRLAIARALIGNPKILLLDEATSALDAESEIKVQNALGEASKGRTTVVIAHRLSTLRSADEIVVMDEGRVMETGRHDELAEKVDNIYAKLVAAQQFDDSDDPTEQMERQATEYKRQESKISDQTDPTAIDRLRRRSIAQVSILSGSSRYGGCYNDAAEFDRRLSSPSEGNLEADDLRVLSEKKALLGWHSCTEVAKAATQC